MGLFEKKYCSICGEKIGLLGNKKLEDGNLCGDCAKKLSPFFNERRHSTVEAIREQLAYREANKAEVEAFDLTRTLGYDMKVLLDDNARKVIFTRSSKWKDANPDVLPFEAITGCDTEIDESKTEEKTEDDEGKKVSYDPPRFTYDYSFKMTVHVDNPYFDEINLTAAESVEEEDKVFGKTTLHFHGDEYKASEAAMLALKKEILLLNGLWTEEEAPAEEDAPAEPVIPAEPQKVTCPYCGAETIPDEKGCCEYCGGTIA